ncbi:MAG: ABC transporter permease [Desulfobacteraceae bacterium]|jgi:simple sugar transport system permease protein|nr:ABC transporter permease [Desulfobacteraceae bacterium]
MMDTILAILASGIRLSIPYTLAGLGGTYSERSGVVNIGLEGMMLTGAFTAVAVTNTTGNAWVGLLAAILVGMLLGLVHAVVCVTFKADQIVSGLALIVFAAGITVFCAWLLYNQTQIQVEAYLRVPVLHTIPFFKGLFNQIPPLVFLTVAIVIASHFVIFKTVFGLRLRSVGEHPRAADTLGISVAKMRYTGVIISGALAGMAGAYLSLEHAHYFVKGISGGRGFIGLASMIFGKWTPFGTAGAGMLFGFGEALKPYLPKVVPSQFIDMIPYILTILVLTSAIGRATPPASIGVPYIKE